MNRAGRFASAQEKQRNRPSQRSFTMKPIVLSSIAAKAANAWRQRRRHNPLLPEPIVAEAKVTTVTGRLAVILPLSNGTTTGYTLEPTYRLVALTRGQLAPYQSAEAVRAKTPHEQLKALCAAVLDRLAAVEHDGDLAEARRTAAINGTNGVNGVNAANGATHAFAPSPAE
jgi:hypothetical protein